MPALESRNSPTVAVPVLKAPPSPLAATRFQLAIVDLLATLKIEQRYRNTESQPIEVSYTIALPTGAELLDFAATIGGRTLRGQVEPRRQAELRYEDALAEGHSAFSIKRVDDGLLNIALGNLLPGEEMTLDFTLAQWLTRNASRVRFTLPTTIAPRYGTSTLQPQDRPVTGLLASHGFQLEGTVRGALAGAELASPTHRLGVRAGVDGTLGFSIHSGQLDRDIVIDLTDVQAAQTTQLTGTLARDVDGTHAAMLAFCAADDRGTPAPVLAEFVLDCSGSMQGVSIEQARRALKAIVAALTPADRFNVLCFGNHHKLLLRRPQALTPVIQRTVLDAADTLQADMGGTELMSALHAALDDLERLPPELPGERILFIVSDGEVWNPDHQRFLQRCAAAHVRVFAVAVGTAAVEATFLPLTQGSGGMLERVLPGDDMAARIQRHFQRARGGLLKSLAVRWPGTPGWMRGPDAVYAGDGCVLSAGVIVGVPDGEASAEIEWIDASGLQHQRSVTLVPIASATAPDDTARMLAAGRLTEIHEPDAQTAWAVRYQLQHAATALTLVLERAADQRADRLPELRQVEHMLPAGSLSAGEVMSCMDLSPDFAVSAAAAPGTGDFDLPPPPMSAPMPAPAAPVQRAAAKAGTAPGGAGAGLFKKLFGRKPAAMAEAAPEGTRQTLVGGRQPLPAWITTLARQLTVQFKAQPAAVAALITGRFTLDQLVQAPDVDIFNALDELAEKVQLELADGRFWQALVWALDVVLKAGGAVRRDSDLSAVATRLPLSEAGKALVNALSA